MNKIINEQFKLINFYDFKMLLSAFTKCIYKAKYMVNGYSELVIEYPLVKLTILTVIKWNFERKTMKEDER